MFPEDKLRIKWLILVGYFLAIRRFIFPWTQRQIATYGIQETVYGLYLKKEQIIKIIMYYRYNETQRAPESSRVQLKLGW